MTRAGKEAGFWVSHPNPTTPLSRNDHSSYSAKPWNILVSSHPCDQVLSKSCQLKHHIDREPSSVSLPLAPPQLVGTLETGTRGSASSSALSTPTASRILLNRRQTLQWSWLPIVVSAHCAMCAPHLLLTVLAQSYGAQEISPLGHRLQGAPKPPLCPAGLPKPASLTTSG